MPKKGYKQTENHIKNNAESRKGYKHTEKTKRKMSENHLGVSGEKNPAWKGGRFKQSGYWQIYNPNHPRVKNNKSTNYIAEHILVAEKMLGRYLTKDEIVHHINFIKTDNNPKNIHVFENGSKHRKTVNSLHKTIKKIMEKGYLKFDKEKGEYY